MIGRYCSLLLITFLWTGADARAQSPGLSITIRNVRDSKGNIGVALYRSGPEFMKTIWKGRNTAAQKGEIHVVFDDIPAGTYAISVMHDSNGNGKLDTNFVGVPREGFGFSNDASGSFGPPSFDDAKFDYDGKEKKLTINLKYY
jgi:uncharacterized protein (DUF2141 family)